MSDPAKRDTTGDLFWRLERIHTALQESHLQTLKPISVYVDSIMPVQKRMADILPRRGICEQLIQAYVSVSEGLYRVIHVPTFLQEFEAYWVHGVNGNVGGTAVSGGEGGAGGQGGVTEDFLPRLLCILCIGGRFDTDSKGLAYDRSDGVHIPTACALVRSWLDGLRGKPAVDLNTLQTEVLLLHASRMILPTQKIWTELGMISRLGMVMGLHRDPSEFAPDVTPFEAECRRKLWFTIMDMDLHVSLASSLPSALRPGEFTCRPPRNLDDADLYPDMPALPPGKPMDQYTEGQMQLFAADTLPLRMRASDLLCKVDSLTDYWEVLDVGSDLEKALDDINCLFPRNAALNSRHKHKEWRMRAMLDMHVRRPLLSLYRPFALSASAECPPPAAISDVYLKSSMAMLTYMEELDPTTPSFDHVSHMYYVILRNDIVQAAFSVCYYIMQAVEAETSPSGNQADASSPPLAHTTPHTHGAAGAAAAAPPPPLTSSRMATPGSAGSWDPGRNNTTTTTTTTITTTSTNTNTNTDNSSNNSGATARHTASAARNKKPLIWTSSYMIRTVERTVDSLARLVEDLSFDLRDVIALATVLGSVMPASSAAQRSEHIRTQVGRVYDTCVNKLHNHSSPAVSFLFSFSLPSPPPPFFLPRGILIFCYNKMSLTSCRQIRAAVLGQSMQPMAHPGAGGYGGRPSMTEEAPLWDASFWDLWAPRGA